MGKIKDIRAGLATAIDTISGLQGEAYVRDNPDVPVAQVSGPDNGEYDQTFGRGHDDWEFGVILLVQRTSDEEGQELLDSYLDPFGPSSVKQAIEADPTLGGVVEDLRVVRTQEYGAVEMSNGAIHLGAVMVVKIMAPGKP